MNATQSDKELKAKIRRVFRNRTHKFPDKKVEIIQPPETRNQWFIIAPYDQVIEKLAHLIAEETNTARIQELERFKDTDVRQDLHNNHQYMGYISERLATLKANKGDRLFSYL